MDKDKTPRSVLELRPTVRPLQFEEHGISTEEGWSSTTGDPEGKKVVESELTSSPEMGSTTVEFKPMSSLSTSTTSETVRLMSKAVKRRAKNQDGGYDENEPITQDSERSVRRQENAHKGYGNSSFYEEPEKIRDTQEGPHLEKSMKEIPILRLILEYRTPTVESKDFDMGPLSQQLDIGSQAMDKNDTSDRRAVGKEIKVIADEVDRWEDDRSPEYIPSSEVENHHPCLALDSPSTKQHRIENTRKSHMATASNALDYYHSKHPGDDYTPVHVNLKHVIFLVDTRGYYIHMNFTARNTKDGTEKIFFAELYLSFEGQDDEWVVTACDIVGPESLGGLRHIWCPDGIAFVGDTMDVQNCYACDDFIKHIDGTMYEAGHRGHCAYEVTDISEE